MTIWHQYKSQHLLFSDLKLLFQILKHKIMKIIIMLKSQIWKEVSNSCTSIWKHLTWKYRSLNQIVQCILVSKPLLRKSRLLEAIKQNVSLYVKKKKVKHNPTNYLPELINSGFCLHRYLQKEKKFKWLQSINFDLKYLNKGKLEQLSYNI